MKKKTLKKITKNQNIIIAILILIIIFLGWWTLSKPSNSRDFNNNTIAPAKHLTPECKDAVFNEDGSEKLGYVVMDNGEGYYAFNNRIYYCIYFVPVGSGKTNCICKKANNATSNGFQIINGRYAAYKNKIYCGEKILNDADYNTFEILNNPIPKSLAEYYAKDKNHYYRHCNEITKEKLGIYLEKLK